MGQQLLLPQRVFPLEAEGEFGTQLVHKPLSLTEFKQLQIDLGSYTDNSDGYIEHFQHVTVAHDLTWRDVWVILTQTLIDTELERMTQEKFSNGLHLTDPNYPLGDTAIPPWILDGTKISLTNAVLRTII